MKAKHVRGVVDSLLNKWENRVVKKARAIDRAWDVIADEKTKRHARPRGLKKGIITVNNHG